MNNLSPRTGREADTISDQEIIARVLKGERYLREIADMNVVETKECLDMSEANVKLRLTVGKKWLFFAARLPANENFF